MREWERALFTALQQSRANQVFLKQFRRIRWSSKVIQKRRSGRKCGRNRMTVCPRALNPSTALRTRSLQIALPATGFTERYALLLSYGFQKRHWCIDVMRSCWKRCPINGERTLIDIGGVR